MDLTQAQVQDITSPKPQYGQLNHEQGGCEHDSSDNATQECHRQEAHHQLARLLGKGRIGAALQMGQQSLQPGGGLVWGQQQAPPGGPRLHLQAV